MQKMRTSSAGIDLIKKFEGCRLKAYKDIIGVITIGYGHVDSGLRMGMIITQQQADQLLIDDLVKFEKGLSDMVTVDLSQNQFDALIDFVYNVGLGNFQNSHLRKYVNSLDFDLAAEQFTRWNRAGGRVIPELAKRRQAEKILFLTPNS